MHDARRRSPTLDDAGRRAASFARGGGNSAQILTHTDGRHAHTERRRTAPVDVEWRPAMRRAPFFPVSLLFESPPTLKRCGRMPASIRAGASWRGGSNRFGTTGRGNQPMPQLGKSGDRSPVKGPCARRPGAGTSPRAKLARLHRPAHAFPPIRSTDPATEARALKYPEGKLAQF